MGKMFHMHALIEAEINLSSRDFPAIPQPVIAGEYEK